MTYRIGDTVTISVTATIIDTDGTRIAAIDSRGTRHVIDVTDEYSPFMVTKAQTVHPACPFGQDEPHDWHQFLTDRPGVRDDNYGMVVSCRGTIPHAND